MSIISMRPFRTGITALRRGFGNHASKSITQSVPGLGKFAKVGLTLGLGTIAFWAQSRLHKQEASNSEELVVRDIGVSSDFKEKDLRVVQLGPDVEKDSIIVVRLDGKLYACCSRCSHMGAPMTRGYLFDDRIYCPYHLASYSVKTGYPDTGPVVDAIPVYPVTEKDGKVTVEVPKSFESNRTKVPAGTRDSSNTQRFVIVGGGVAGGSCAETLRQSGFTGEILMISAESTVPYDRSYLTKDPMNITLDKIKIRDESYLNQIGITIKNNSMVTDLDSKNKTLTLQDGSKITYDKVLLATGGKPNKLKIPGADLKRVYTIRDIEDIEDIRTQLRSIKGTPNVVCIGGGFVSNEAASNIKMDMKSGANLILL